MTFAERESGSAGARRWLTAGLAIWLTGWLLVGCVSSKVQTGAAVGALSGAAAGAGVGLLISDEDLLGSPADAETGDTSLSRGGSLAAGLAIGVVVGAIVGAMVGHQQERSEPVRPARTLLERVDEPAAEADLAQAR